MEQYPPKLTSRIAPIDSPLNNILCPGCTDKTVSSLGIPISNEGMNSIITCVSAIDTRNVEITSGFVIESNVGDVENIIIPTVFTCNPGIIPVIVPMIIPNIKVIKISNIIY